MFAIKALPFHWRVLALVLEIGFLFVPDLEAAKDWSLLKVKAEDTEELTIECPSGTNIIIAYAEYGNKDHDCSDVFNQYSLALKCNYKQECHFAKVDDGMKTACPAGVKKYLDLHYRCMSGQNELHFSQLTREDEEHDIKCPLNMKIYIVNAVYSDKENTCVINATEDVSYSCWKNECNFYGMFHDIIDTSCPQVEKLLISHICNEEEYLIEYAFEGRPTTIKCPHNYVIDVLHANYSDPMHDCKPNKVDTHIKKRCSSKKQCVIKGTTFEKFPSGCGTDMTELQIYYKCLHLKEIRKYTVFENGLVELSCYHYNQIKVIQATFGKSQKGCGSADAMTRLKEACDGKRICCGTANSKLLGNSTCAENSAQKLRVTYECTELTDGHIDLERKECERIHFKVSPSFGEITSETVKKMDNNLVLMIGTSFQRLQQISTETYNGIVEYMEDIPSLEIVPGSSEDRNDSYSSFAHGITDMITRTESKYEAITWYTNFINNRQIIDDAHIDIDFLADVMTETGVHVRSFQSFWSDQTVKRAEEVDISILRFPDIQHPYFLVYHIRIEAWRISSRQVFYESTSGGLNGLFQCIKFQPNKKYLSSLKLDVIESAIAEAESLFD